MEAKFCQSCGMPMASADQHGTNKDQSLNDDYCIYCYEDGAFILDCSMDEMINHCAQFVSEFNEDSDQKLTKEQAVAQMKQFFPTLKRWTSK